jgi:hypothetical protein
MVICALVAWNNGFVLVQDCTGRRQVDPAQSPSPTEFRRIISVKIPARDHEASCAARSRQAAASSFGLIDS